MINVIFLSSLLFKVQRVKFLVLGVLSGTGWSLFQGTGQSGEGTFLPANYEDGVWIREAKGDKRRHTGVDFPGDIRVPSSVAERLHEWNWEDKFSLSKVLQPFVFTIKSYWKRKWLTFCAPNSFLTFDEFLCSAVDQFRKQFAHLEENGGKSGPVIPLERKHVSLPR